MDVLLKIFPAGDGDCFVCEFDNDGKPFRLMVDGGVRSTFESHTKAWLNTLQGDVDLAVVTHIDDDHIAGVIEILKDSEAWKKIKSIWFNGYRHLSPRASTQTFSVAQGESLSDQIDNRKIPWNEHFGQNAVRVNDDGSPRVIQLGSTAKITILSPGISELTKLKRDWDLGLVKLEAKAKKNLGEKSALQTFACLDVNSLADPSLYTKDNSSTNASSIAFLLEVNNCTILFAADALAEVICASWSKGINKIREIDAFKVSHHGSAKNTNKDLLRLFPAKKYIISTSGETHSHPDYATLARIITQGKPRPVLIFNYMNEITSLWADTSVSNGRHTAKHANDGQVLEIPI